ncbi:transcriptional regulator [Saccharobesus litoralis]|uniref:Transcriptional regulator n=1 Tax=Saccharobesus litoralis TaxID=2172099 RepID=A0A2S0VXS7_9ALTE|nr:metalloregulator ArsR/SmtB family transcription factor [Saccharobesus litoralis]AWB69029.1 transcriptional regulator [Saccharobesus litoralis]
MKPTIFFKCLADELRLKSILLLHLEQELCVCELMVALNEASQPKVSRHLAQLKKAGLLIDRKQSQWVYYKIDPALNSWIHETIKITAQQNSDFLTESVARLAKMGDRPTREKQCCG